jgi:hypothetical protein
MSDSANLEILLLLFPYVIFFIGLSIYTAYRAFSIRRVSLVPIHRYQALWVGATAIYWIVEFVYLSIELIFYFLYPNIILAAKIPIAVSGIASLLFGLAFIFAWVDVSVPIARNSDPRNRDILHWRYMRLIIWATVFLNVALASYFLVPSILSMPGTGGLGPYGLVVLFYSKDGPYFVANAVISVAVLLVSYNHSQEGGLRRHLKWFSVSVASLLFLSLLVTLERGEIASYFSGNLPFASFLYIFAITLTLNSANAFFIFMCARSLAPINRFPPRTFVESKL